MSAPELSKVRIDIDNLTESLGALGCRFVFFEIDCPDKNVSALCQYLKTACACDAVAKKKDDGYWQITASTETAGCPSESDADSQDTSE